MELRESNMMHGQEEEEIVFVSSSVDAGIRCLGLHSGKEYTRHRSCVSPPHGLVSVGHQFIASSQLQLLNPRSSTGSILYWSWNKPQPETRSFTTEPINPLVCYTNGVYLIGGGFFGTMFLWQVESGMLLRKWNAHYRAITCLALSDDESLLISGGEDGCVKVWALIELLDDHEEKMESSPLEVSFTEHTLKVTDIVSGYGGCGAIIISSSEDRTCKVWSLSERKLLRTVRFNSIVNTVALEPAERVFYAGCGDGKIYIAALSSERNSCAIYGDVHIVDALYNSSKAVTCLTFSKDGTSLVSGADDGVVRVWNTKTHHILRQFGLVKGPISNVLALRTSSQSLGVDNARGVKSMKYPALDNSVNANEKPVVATFKPPRDKPLDCLQVKWPSSSPELELERWRHALRRSQQLLQKQRKMCENLLNATNDTRRRTRKRRRAKEVSDDH